MPGAQSNKLQLHWHRIIMERISSSSSSSGRRRRCPVASAVAAGEKEEQPWGVWKSSLKSLPADIIRRKEQHAEYHAGYLASILRVTKQVHGAIYDRLIARAMAALQ